MGGSPGEGRERPSTPQDPWDIRVGLGVASDGLHTGIAAVKAMLGAAGHDQAAAVWMDVGVLESRNQHSSSERHDPSAGADPSVDLLVRTESDDAPSPENH